MTIYLILKISAVGIIVFVINSILDQVGKKEYSIWVSICGLLLVLYWVIPYVADLFKYIQNLFQL